MATWHGSRGVPLPEKGDAFAFAVTKGVYSFCWVVGFVERGNAYVRGVGSHEVDRIAVAGAKWFGHTPPTAEDLATPEVLVTTFWKSSLDGPLVTMVQEAPPKAMKPIGKIGRAKVPRAKGYGGWPAILAHARDQWRHETNPRRFAREERTADEKINRDMEADSRKEETLRARRKTATLAQLTRDKQLLAELVGLMTKRHVEVLHEHLRTLIRAIDKAETRKTKLATIEQCVDAINAWNGKVSVIDTPEREVLIDVIDDIARAAGLRGKDLAGPFRDW